MSDSPVALGRENRGLDLLPSLVITHFASVMTSTRHPLLIASVLLVGTVTGSCDLSRFSRSKRTDLQAFSAQTTAILGEFNPAFSDLGFVRLRSLLEPSGAEETRLRDLTTRQAKQQRGEQGIRSAHTLSRCAALAAM